jgi:hypothetical protein
MLGEQSVSRYQKIFLASALVIAGFGVAKFLGQPVLPLQSLWTPNGASHAASIALESTNQNSPAPQPVGNIRLTPEPPIRSTNTALVSQEVATPETPMLTGTLARAATVDRAADFSATPRIFDNPAIVSAPLNDSISSRARLRNEAPRPIGVDPQSPVAIRRMPAIDGMENERHTFADQQPAAMNFTAPKLIESGPPIDSAAAAVVSTAYSAPVAAARESRFAPPPWPDPDEAADPRTHTIVDGDSLEKLASRYLGDPRRSREVFELNRDVLSAPDLLPIGAELKLPERLATASSRRDGFSPNSSDWKTNGADSANKNASPAANAPQVITPRAQLAPPIMVQ